MCNGKNNSTGLLLAMVAGAAVGTLVGLLVAPNSGKKTRKKIKEKTRDLNEQAKKSMIMCHPRLAKQQAMWLIRSQMNLISIKIK